MQHPVLKNLKSALVYAFIWLCLSIFDYFFYFSGSHTDWASGIFASIIINTLFSFIGIAIWYAVVYSFPEGVGVFNLIVNHITAAAVLIAVWVTAGLFLIKMFTTEPLYNFVLGHIFWYIFTGAIYYALIVLIYYIVIYNYNLKERKKNEDKLLLMVKEAELNLLKSQINPHFLFNSLNSISSLTITNPVKAQEMIIKLSDFLRYSISRNSNQKSNLGFELENIQRYLDIEKIRFGSRLEYQPNLDESSLKAHLPVMILQPLFENAIKHGVYESIEPIRIHIKACVEGNFLIFTITNNFDAEMPSRKGAGIGLKNIKERLRLTYQREGLIAVHKTETSFEVKLTIPQDEHFDL